MDYSALLIELQASLKACEEAARREDWIVATSGAVRCRAVSQALIDWMDEKRGPPVAGRP